MMVICRRNSGESKNHAAGVDSKYVVDRFKSIRSGRKCVRESRCGDSYEDSRRGSVESVVRV